MGDHIPLVTNRKWLVATANLFSCPGFVTKEDDDDRVDSPGRRSEMHHLRLARTAHPGIAVDYTGERKGPFWAPR